MATAQVIDADTIVVPVDGERTSFRLAGMDAPELGQVATDALGRRFDAGELAKEVLVDYLEKMQKEGWEIRIRADREGLDKYGRQLGRVELTRDGSPSIDVCEWMVREGWCVAEYGTQYREAERDARHNLRGLWAGEFERPKDYRRAQRETRSVSAGTIRRRRSGGPSLWRLFRDISRMTRMFR